MHVVFVGGAAPLSAKGGEQITEPALSAQDCCPHADSPRDKNRGAPPASEASVEGSAVHADRRPPRP